MNAQFSCAGHLTIRLRPGEDIYENNDLRKVGGVWTEDHTYFHLEEISEDEDGTVVFATFSDLDPPEPGEFIWHPAIPDEIYKVLRYGQGGTSNDGALSLLNDGSNWFWAELSPWGEVGSWRIESE